MASHRINKVWVDNSRLWLETTDGLKAYTEFSQWQTLAKATPQQRKDFYLTRSGIHWRELDEDLNFEGVFSDMGLCERTKNEDSVFYQM